MSDEAAMPVIFLSGAISAGLAACALFGGLSVWTALGIYALGGAALALSTLLGAMVAITLEDLRRHARRPDASRLPLWGSEGR